MPLRSAFCLLAAVTLSACGGGDTSPDAAAPDSLAAASATAETNNLTLTDEGVGRLTAATLFDTASVRDALPAGFAVELRSVETEAGVVPVVWALRDGILVLEVYPDAAGTAVGRVDAPGEDVSGPDGARVGQTFGDVDGSGMDCESGTEELSGRAVCERDGVSYVFASQAIVGRATLPPADSLGDALLERLVWRAE